MIYILIQLTALSYIKALSSSLVSVNEVHDNKMFIDTYRQ